MVESDIPLELEERSCVVPEVKDDLLTETIANLELHESFVYKHGVLESWNLVGKKLGIEPPDPSSSVSKENQVSSVDWGGFDIEKRDKVTRRGRTPFDWEAFNLEMQERAKDREG